MPANTGAVAVRASKQPGRSVQPVPRISVETLLAGGREAVLLHGGSEYRLYLTSNGKLILTK